MLRAVLDAGVLVSALITPAGSTAGLLRAWKAGEFELVVSPALLEELEGVLKRPKFRDYITVSEARQYVALLRERAELVDDPAEIEPITPDPKDDYLVALARAARVHVLVSGDPHIAGLTASPVPIQRPREFLERCRNQ